MVLFSAAVPFQTRPKPVNPQWAEVWAQHFRHARFRCFDILRGALWADPAVDWHVAQNLLLFVREDSAAFAGFPAQPTEGPLSLVPPAGLAGVGGPALPRASRDRPGRAGRLDARLGRTHPVRTNPPRAGQ